MADLRSPVKGGVVAVLAAAGFGLCVYANMTRHPTHRFGRTVGHPLLTHGLLGRADTSHGKIWPHFDVEPFPHTDAIGLDGDRWVQVHPASIKYAITHNQRDYIPALWRGCDKYRNQKAELLDIAANHTYDPNSSLRNLLASFRMVNTIASLPI
jgi:hypothetical protein